MEDPEAERVEAVLDKAAEGVEEPVVEPSVEAVLDKAAEGVEETVVELRVEALEAGEIFRQRPQQDTRLSLGQGAGVIEDSSFVEEPIVESPIETVSDKAIEGVEGPVVESRPQQDTRLSLGRGSY